MPKHFLSWEKIQSFSELFAHFDYGSRGVIHYLNVFEILQSMSVEIS